MNDKSKDTVFGVVLFALGGYVTLESLLMIERASGPPLRIKQLPLSPGIFPLVLGILLMMLSVLLIANSLKGSDGPWSALAGRLKAVFVSIGKLSGDRDFRIMLTGIVMMFVYCFFIIGNIPFWASATGILLVMTIFLRFADQHAPPVRAADIGIIVLVSAATVLSTILLFENVFGTTLP